MKKLSVLIALALCLTIGGAYATWTFAVGQVTDTNATVSNIGIGMVVKNDGGSMGELTATFENYGYSVVPGDGTTIGELGNIPMLQNDKADAKLIITFVAAANAEDSIKRTGITVDVDLSVATDFTSGKYSEVLGVADTHGITIKAGTSTTDIDKGDWTSRTENTDGTVTFVYEITSATVMSWMKVANANALTNYDDATVYAAAVTTGKYQIVASAK